MASASCRSNLVQRSPTLPYLESVFTLSLLPFLQINSFISDLEVNGKKTNFSKQLHQ